jgi:hypothetical protein
MTVVAEPPRRIDTPTVVMHDVPWDCYVRLVELPGNAHLRMTYNKGELEIMPPLRKRLSRSLSASGFGNGYALK